MQVILKKDVQNLGEAGELVNVKDGYARNFLIPKNFAEIATEGALKNREQNIARIKAKQEKLHQEALAKAAEIEKLGQIELSAKAGESGKLFGTITTKKLCEELKEKANIEVDRKTVSLNAPINKIGEYKMLIKLTSKVKCELAISVSASEVVKESIEELPERIKTVRLIHTTGDFIERCSVEEAKQKYGDWTYSSGYSESFSEVSLWIRNTTK